MYTPHTEADIKAMLSAIGVRSLDDLLQVPESIALKAQLDVVPAPFRAKFTTLGLKPNGCIRRNCPCFPKDVGAGQGRVSAQRNLDGWREPA